MLKALDEAPITRRYVILAVSVMIGAVLDLFDFFLIAFVVPIVVGRVGPDIRARPRRCCSAPASARSRARSCGGGSASATAASGR